MGHGAPVLSGGGEAAAVEGWGVGKGAPCRELEYSQGMPKKTKSATRRVVPAKRQRAAARPIRKAIAPKTEGNAAVRGYIEELAPWQRAVVKRADRLVTRQVPDLNKAIKWGVPFYGVDGEGWFLAVAAYQRHVKLMFFKGATFSPPPPVGKIGDNRSLDVRESDLFDESQFANWVHQAASVPGWGAKTQKARGSARGTRR